MWFKVTLFVVYFIITGTYSSIRVVEIRGPSSVRNASDSKVVLDCVFEADLEDRNSLVVKWHLNGDPVPVYQWIPGNLPQDLGPLKNRLDLDNRVTSDGWSEFRALTFLHPTTDLTGEYTCSVTSFEAEDSMSKNFVVYAPPSRVSLTYSKPLFGKVLVWCKAEEAFPAPHVSVSKSSPFLERSHRHVMSGSKVSRSLVTDGNSFNSSVKVSLYEFDLRSATLFVCEIALPGTAYQLEKELYYEPGQPSPEPSVFYLSSSSISSQPNFLTSLLAVIAYLVHNKGFR